MNIYCELNGFKTLNLIYLEMQMKIIDKKLNGFTLAELLVVLCIIGILVLLALPKLLPLISRTKSMEAQLQLKHVLQLEKSYFYIHSKYSESITEIGFEQSKLVSENGTANYKIQITGAAQNTFSAIATAVADFDGDGTFNVWEINQDEAIKELVPD
jgi:type IV pilus assembly protein PilE